jgi:hypothetical protein
VYHKEAVRVCDWCDDQIKSNPFTRTVGDEIFLYCSNDCLHAHFKMQGDVNRLQGRLQL